MKVSLHYFFALLMVIGFVLLSSSVSLAVDKTQRVKIVPGGKEVTVKPGDTLSHLCLEYYVGDSEEDCRFIADINGMSTDEVLKPGKKFFIPFVYRVVAREVKSGKKVGCTDWYADRGAVEEHARYGNMLLPTLKHKVERK